METIRIYAQDILDAHYHEDSGITYVRRIFESAYYYVNASYYAASMFDRGFITVTYEV